ncbi:hypothetical protein L0222_25720 [bacterium]|nr:hypothetical protein [bacterium]
MIDAVIRKLERIDKKLSLEVMRPPEPDYIAQTPGVATWFDTWKGLNTNRPVPWDPYLLKRFKAFAKALGDHTVPDAAKDGELTPLRDHPVLTNINLAIPGAHAAIRNPVQFRLINMPGYSRENFKNAVLVDLYAVTGNFPKKFGYIGFWDVKDKSRVPTLWEEIRAMILAEFDGSKNPRIGFFQENLAASKDTVTGVITGTPVPTFAAALHLSRDSTFTMFQMLQSWKNPFSNPEKTANTIPADAIKYAYETYRCAYFEIYVADLDERNYWPSFPKGTFSSLKQTCSISSGLTPCLAI